MAQCAASHEVGGFVWYCVKEKHRKGEHEDDQGRRWKSADTRVEPTEGH